MQRITKTVKREPNPDLVRMRARTELAALTLRALRVHNLKPKRLMAAWPNVLKDYWESYGNLTYKNTPAAPSSLAIDDLDAVMILMNRALDVTERGVVWDRAFRMPWKITCKKLHCDRTTLWRIYTLAIMKMVALEKGVRCKSQPITVETAAPKVYVMQAETSKAVKIGWSYDPEQRRAEIEIGCPEKIILLGWCYGSVHHEKAIHAHLSPHKIRGEWFSPAPLVLAAVEKIKEGKSANDVLQHLEDWRQAERVP